MRWPTPSSTGRTTVPLQPDAVPGTAVASLLLQPISIYASYPFFPFLGCASLASRFHVHHITLFMLFFVVAPAAPRPSLQQSGPSSHARRVWSSSLTSVAACSPSFSRYSTSLRHVEEGPCNEQVMKPRDARDARRRATLSRSNKSSSSETTSVLALSLYGSLSLAHAAWRKRGSGVRKQAVYYLPATSKKWGSVCTGCFSPSGWGPFETKTQDRHEACYFTNVKYTHCVLWGERGILPRQSDGQANHLK